MHDDPAEIAAGLTPNEQVALRSFWNQITGESKFIQSYFANVIARHGFPGLVRNRLIIRCDSRGKPWAQGPACQITDLGRAVAEELKKRRVT